MSRNVLAVDLAIAVVIAAILLIASPGPAVDLILALVLIVACAIGYVISRRGARRRSALR